MNLERKGYFFYLISHIAKMAFKCNDTHNHVFSWMIAITIKKNNFYRLTFEISKNSPDKLR